MKKVTTHKEQPSFLRKIEGQIRGVQKMIDQERYCIDILTQLHSIVGAILRVEDKVLKRHLEGCVTKGLKGKSDSEKQKNIDEVIKVISRFRRH